MKFKTSQLPRFRRPHKKLVVIILVCLIGIGLITYGLLSYLNWQGLEQRSAEAAQTLKKSINTSLASEKTSEDPAKQIDAVVSQFEKTYGATPCEVSAVYKWQTILPPIRELQDKCEQRVSHALALTEALKPLSAFLKAEQAASTLISETILITSTQKDYAASGTAWEQLISSEKISQTEDFAPVREKITAIATAIGDAYKKLDQAIKDEDKAAFDSATEALTASYSTISELTAIAETIRDRLINTVLEQYEKL